MNHSEAVELLRPAMPGPGGTWADMGAGEGIFTRALAELVGPNGRVYAVDNDASAVSALRAWSTTTQGRVTPVQADFARSFDAPESGTVRLRGMLFANSLHFVRDAEIVLARLTAWLEPAGRVVIIEYDRRAPSRWVPFPISMARLPALLESAGLSPPTIVATRPSRYGGDMYVAVAERA